MKIVNIHQAKTHLSRLVEEAVAGESFIIAKAGKPLVKVVALDESVPVRRLGFMIGSGMLIPDDFDRMGEDEIVALFEQHREPAS